MLLWQFRKSTQSVPIIPLLYLSQKFFGGLYGIRTRNNGVTGHRDNRFTNRPALVVSFHHDSLVPMCTKFSFLLDMVLYLPILSLLCSLKSNRLVPYKQSASFCNSSLSFTRQIFCVSYLS